MIPQFHYESEIHTCVQEMRLAAYKIFAQPLHYVQLPRYRINLSIHRYMNQQKKHGM